MKSVYWETFNNKQIITNAYIRSSNFMEYNITDEFSTKGDYSLKCSSQTNWNWLYYGLPQNIMNQITGEFTFKCDVSTTGGEILIIINDDSGERNVGISLSSGSYPVEISYNDSFTNLYRVQLGYRNRSGVLDVCYIDNIRLYF